MRFFHISDLHIGLKLLNRDLYEDQEYILKKIVQYAKEYEPDAVVLAGDIYDRSMPSAEAVGLFDSFINELREAVPKAYILMISGNHDSGARLNLYRNILAKEKLYSVGLPPMTNNERIEKVTLSDKFGEVNFYLLPFVKPSMVKNVFDTAPDSYDDAVRLLIERENIDLQKRNVIVSHQFYLPNGENPENIKRADSEIVTVGNIDEVFADILCKFDYAALGHIHKASKVKYEHIRYAGTPIACSVSEAGQEKGFLMIDLFEKGNVNVETITLEPLRRVRKLEGILEDVLKEASEDYVEVTILGDILSSDDITRVRNAFPNLLDIKRKGQREASVKRIAVKEGKNEFELMKEFLGDMSEDEERILRDIILNM